jgi:hypothetical protein
MADTRVKASDLIGNWKETSRMTKGQAQAYTDTARVEFLVGNEYVWGRPASFMYRGTYVVSGSNLDLGSSNYTILSHTGNRLTLKDENGQYVFTRYVKTPDATDNSAAGSSNRGATGDLNGTAPSDISSLMGRWEVYKRTSEKRGTDLPDYNTLLRVIEVKQNDKGQQGLVYAAADMDGKPSWYIDRYSNGLVSAKGKSDRTLRILKATGTELIINEAGITYFFRKMR